LPPHRRKENDPMKTFSTSQLVSIVLLSSGAFGSFAAAAGRYSALHATPNWDACIQQSFGPRLHDTIVGTDEKNGVAIQLVGESGKTITFSIYPSEARQIASLLIESSQDDAGAPR
jgi:hypothetical protein